MTNHTSTPAPQDTWTENTAILWQTDEPVLPTPDRDDNPYANYLTEWDIDADGILAAACEMSWEVWGGVTMYVCLTHETH